MPTLASPQIHVAGHEHSPEVERFSLIIWGAGGAGGDKDGVGGDKDNAGDVFISIIIVILFGEI
jgi:hypothetical protein